MDLPNMFVWLDCDPGHDDMLAMILAAKSPRLTLLGVSTSAGNSTIQNTTQNALDILNLIGRNDLVVVQGADRPLLGKINTAEECHGPNGLEGAALPHSPCAAITHQPYLGIYNRIMQCAAKVHFVNTGSMTNLALLLRAFPDIKDKIAGISFMGGAIGLGNWSPSAEFNILVDPIAASIVFQSELPIVMVPLQVTHTALITEDIFQKFLELPNGKLGRILHDLNRQFQLNYKNTQNFDYPPSHDPCAVFYLLNSAAFKARNVQIRVIQASVSVDCYPSSYGRTNCDFKSSRPNALVCQAMDVQEFWKTMLEACSVPNNNFGNRDFHNYPGVLANALHSCLFDLLPVRYRIKLPIVMTAIKQSKGVSVGYGCLAASDAVYEHQLGSFYISPHILKCCMVDSKAEFLHIPSVLSVSLLAVGSRLSIDHNHRICLKTGLRQPESIIKIMDQLSDYIEFDEYFRTFQFEQPSAGSESSALLGKEHSYSDSSEEKSLQRTHENVKKSQQDSASVDVNLSQCGESAVSSHRNKQMDLEPSVQEDVEFPSIDGQSDDERSIQSPDHPSESDDEERNPKELLSRFPANYTYRKATNSGKFIYGVFTEELHRFQAYLPDNREKSMHLNQLEKIRSKMGANKNRTIEDMVLLFGIRHNDRHSKWAAYRRVFMQEMLVGRCLELVLRNNYVKDKTNYLYSLKVYEWRLNDSRLVGNFN